jgi:hypothetical protein
VRVLCERSWHLFPVRGSEAKYFLLVLQRKLIKAPDSSKKSKYRLQEPRNETVFIFKKISPKQHLHEPRSESILLGYGSCRKSNSPPFTHYAQSENKKFDTKTKFLKREIYGLLLKNMCANSEIIPLCFWCWLPACCFLTVVYYNTVYLTEINVVVCFALSVLFRNNGKLRIRKCKF